MKIYFEKTNGGNFIIITDEETAKVFDAAPSGIYEGIDLYASNAADLLKKYFQLLKKSGNLNDFDDIYSPNEMLFEDVKKEIESYAELIYDTAK